MIYIGNTFSHAGHKIYRNKNEALPDQGNREIEPYSPTDTEIKLGKTLKRFFENTLDKTLDYFRLDFLKLKDDIFILEVEMVNPGFFYRYLSDKTRQTIQKTFVSYLIKEQNDY